MSAISFNGGCDNDVGLVHTTSFLSSDYCLEYTHPTYPHTHTNTQSYTHAHIQLGIMEGPAGRVAGSRRKDQSEEEKSQKEGAVHRRM